LCGKYALLRELRTPNQSSRKFLWYLWNTPKTAILNQSTSTTAATIPADSACFKPPNTYPSMNFLIATKTKRFGGEEYYTGILTSQQLIFVPMTKDMLKEVTKISQLAKTNALPIYPYQQNYLAMNPDMIVAQTPNCIVLPYASIIIIEVYVSSRTDYEGYSIGEEYRMDIKTNLGNYTFRMTKREEYLARLRQFYPEKIKKT
jgi:hypothetical protein